MTQVAKLTPESPDPKLVARAAELLRGGGVAAFPTDTVYGLGCSARSPRGLAGVRALKGDRASPFILLIAARDWLDDLVRDVTPLAENLIARHWPGPLSIVLDAAPGVEAAVGTGSVAVRLPLSRWCVSLCGALGEPVASTSANASGRPPARHAAEVVEAFGGAIDMVIDGGLSPSAEPSTLVDARGKKPVLLRAGVLKLDI